MADRALNRNQGNEIDHQSRLYQFVIWVANSPCVNDISKVCIAQIIHVFKVATYTF
jgi:hypothetical protein